MSIPKTYSPQHNAARNAFETIDLDIVPPKPRITMENVFDDETDYEAWLMKMIWTRPGEAIPLLRAWVESLPPFDGPADNVDVLPEGSPPVQPPMHWQRTPIHFTPLTDGRYVRVYLAAGRYFQATDDERDGNVLASIYEGFAPKRVLDIGCSTGGSSFALAKLFPEAEIVGVDLGSHFIRAGRALAQRGGLDNVQLYYQDGTATSFPDASFDLVSEAMVMHEMPSVESHKMVREMWRLCRPGGRITVTDAIYDDTDEERQARVERSKGPEPFLADYVKANIPAYLESMGIESMTRHTRPGWDRMIWTGTKPG